MAPDARKLLWDCRQAMLKIQRFVDGRDFAAYRADELLRSAVERQFEIGGEALTQLRRVDPETAGMIPDLPRVVAFRNVLIHGYATVDDRVVWGVIEGRVDALIGTLTALLADA